MRIKPPPPPAQLGPGEGVSRDGGCVGEGERAKGGVEGVKEAGAAAEEEQPALRNRGGVHRMMTGRKGVLSLAEPKGYNFSKDSMWVIIEKKKKK